MTEAHYYPFGLQLSGKWLTGGAEETKYRYNGKELNEDFGLNWLDYGARWYDASIARWNAVDPLAEAYHQLTPYNYVGNMPINAIDPDGKRIIFVNGYLGFGSPEGGSAYWNYERSEFVQGAKRYFNDDDVYFTDIDHKATSSARGRIKVGKKWARENYEMLVDGMNKDEDSFKFITHSMGAAFGEGVLRFLKKKGWNVTNAIHFEPFQANGIEAHTDPPNFGTDENTTIGTFTIDYQLDNDWIINSIPFFVNVGKMKGDEFLVHIKVPGTKSWRTRHREPINSGNIWSVLDDLISKALARDGNTYIQIENDNEDEN